MEPKACPGPSGSTPRRPNTANIVTHSPQAGTRFIPSCNRCKKRKIKCDAGIPSCRACSDSKTTCEYHDTTSKEDVPRARILHMEHNLQQLLNVRAQALRQDDLRSNNVTVDGMIQPDFRGRLVVSGIRLACVFCRRRKIKCDGTAPCAGCTKFGRPEECSILYEEASSQGRSYMLYLDDRISKTSQQLSDPQIFSHLSQQPPALSVVDYHMDSLPSSRGPAVEPVRLEELPRSLQGERSKQVQDVLHEICSLSEASPAVITNRSMHTPWNFRVSLLSLAGYRDETGPFTAPLTLEIIRPLVQHYTNEIHPANPFLSIRDLNLTVEKFHDNTATVDERVKILLVLSIAASALSPHPSSTANWNAHKIFSSATYIAAYNPDTLPGLELNLLVLQFALLNPCKLNAWYLAGLGMRACASMGLHKAARSRGLASSDDIDGSDTQARGLEQWQQRLFWASYANERVLSMSMGRPCGFDDASITVEIPSQESIENSVQNPKCLLLRLRLLRMQSITYGKFFQNRALEDITEEEVQGDLMQMKREFEEWRQEAKTLNTMAYGSLALDSATHELLLYRPSRVLPKRTVDDLECLLQAAIRAIEAAYALIFHRPKKYYNYLMISWTYTASLALLYAASQLLSSVRQADYTTSITQRVTGSIPRASCTLSYLSQEYLMGEDLSQRFMQLQTEFSEWHEKGGDTELPSTEIQEFYKYEMGLLTRNTCNAANWTNVMHQMLVDPGSSRANPAAEETSQSPIKRARRSDGAVSYSQIFPSESEHYTNRSHHETHAQPSTYYDQMKAFAGAVNPVLDYANQNEVTLDQLNATSPYTHLPHRPSLQPSHAIPDAALTPLQQLAATAVNHPGQARYEEALQGEKS